MTTAVCLKCGAFKLGAFTPCLKCGFTPDTREARAKGILLSDHCLDQGQLKEVSGQIKAGKPPEFDEEQIAEMAKDLEEPGPMNFPKPPLGCLMVKWLLIGTMLALAATFAYLLWKQKSGN